MQSVAVKRRDGDGQLEVGPTWESVVERQIREAMADGAFDDLPFQGRPLPADDDPAGEWALAFHVLRNARIAPPWIEADKEVRALLAAREALLERARRQGPGTGPSLRRDLERIVAAANAAITRLNAEAPTDRQHRRLLDLRADLLALDDAPG
jgi:hypothetical protein